MKYPISRSLVKVFSAGLCALALYSGCHRAGLPDSVGTPLPTSQPVVSATEEPESNDVKPPVEDFRIRCFDFKSGKELWSRSSGVLMPVYDFRKVLVFDNSFWTEGVDPESGKKLWLEPGRLFSEQPVDGNLVYNHFLKQPLIRAIDISTGKVAWEVGPYQADLSVSYWQGMLSVPLQDGRVVTLDAKTGEKRWETPGITCVSDGERLYVGERESLYAVDAQGKEIWKNPNLKSFELRGLANGVLLFFGDPVPMTGVSLSEGLMEGRTSLGVSSKDGKVLYQLPKDAVWIDGSSDGKVAMYAIERHHFVCDPATGKTIWEMPFDQPPPERTSQLRNPVVEVDPYLYERVGATTVKVREFATGKVLKTFELTTPYDNVVYGRSPDRYFVVEDPEIHDKQKK